MDRCKVMTDPKKLVSIELKNQGIDVNEIAMPKRVYLMADSLYDEMLKRNVGEFKCQIGGALYVYKDNHSIGFVKSAMCSPAIAIQAEDLVAVGVKELIHIGFSGAIKNNITSGQLIITDGAYNDTAVARLYGYDEEIIYSDKSLTHEIKSMFDKKDVDMLQGLHWTTDAGYHETLGQILDYKEKNVLCVEMEGVGLFTIARYHDIKATGVYIVSDVFDDNGWCLGWSENKISLAITKIINIIIESV